MITWLDLDFKTNVDNVVTYLPLSSLSLLPVLNIRRI